MMFEKHDRVIFTSDCIYYGCNANVKVCYDEVLMVKMFHDNDMFPNYETIVHKKYVRPITFREGEIVSLRRDKGKKITLLSLDGINSRIWNVRHGNNKLDLIHEYWLEKTKRKIILFEDDGKD